MSSAYGFTEDSARRIARVVKSVEGDTTAPGRIGPMLSGSTMSIVEVTALGSPLNTGHRVDYHASVDEMNDMAEIKIKELNNASLTVGQRYIGQFCGYTDSGLPVFVVKNQIVSGGGSTFEVVTGVVCESNGSINVTTASLTTSDFDGAVYKSFLGLLDVVPKSFSGNASRIVLVNSTATALEFGPNFSGAPSTVDFLGLTDVPNSYSNGAYKSVIVNSGSSGLSFVSPNVSTTKSITGGGNPNDTSVFTTIQLSGDQSAPGNYYVYGTNGAGVKGWYENQAQPSGLRVGGNIVVSGRKAAVEDVGANTITSANLAGTASTTQAAIDEITTQLNLILNRMRSHGLIAG